MFKDLETKREYALHWWNINQIQVVRMPVASLRYALMVIFHIWGVWVSLFYVINSLLYTGKSI